MKSSRIVSIALFLLILIPQRAFSAVPALQDLSFEVATIKPSDPEDRSGKFIRMQSTHRFETKHYSVKEMIAAAFNLPNRAISGGPVWADTDRYDILAKTPGEGRPTQDQQMSMLRDLLATRFNLTIHRETKEQPLYELIVGKDGPKLKESNPSTPEYLISTMFNDNHVLLPAKKVTMTQFAQMMQRAVVDRAVIDKTGLTAKYDFNLEWTRDETQFEGLIPLAKVDTSPKPDLFSAVQQQLGLKLQSGRGPVEILVIDRLDRPSDN